MQDRFYRLNAPFFEPGMAEAEKFNRSNKLRKNPLVSVIIPAYNTARTIEACINSILSQTYRNIEIIINDAGSKDKSIEIIRKFKKVKLIFRNPNRSKARNIGAMMAKGKYLFHIDSDMELTPVLVENCVKLCEKKGYDALIVPEVSVGKTFWHLVRAIEKLTFLNDEYMESANRFIKKSVYTAVDGYDESITAGEDFDIHQRLLHRKKKIGRAMAFIKHHEVLKVTETWKKGYVYGRTFKTYIQKYPVLTGKQFSVIRPAYIRNRGLLFSHPLLLLGLIIMKGVMYVYTVAGICVTFLTGRHTRT